MRSESMFDKEFRLNPIFTITPVEKLSEGQKRKFRRVIEKKDIYGLLHAPPGAKATVKALNRKLADFLNRLRRPCKIADLFPEAGEEDNSGKQQFIVQLVLDSVLEVKYEKSFISGVEAVNRVLLPSMKTQKPDVPGSKNHVQALSGKAIDFTLNSALIQPRDMSSFMYNFNRLPLCRRWRQRLPDEASVTEFLGLKEDNSWRGMPERVKLRTVETDEEGNLKVFDQFWRYWYLGDKKEGRETSNYKVYVSPLPEDVPEVFRIVRDDFVHSGACAMKIGRNLTELLRSDKFIVYFSEYKAAFDFAVKLSGSTASYRYQGVPFSFQIDPDKPLVSLGVDPPLKFGERNSWRHYITNKLALAIQGVWRSETKEPLEHINTHMRMVGVDSINWRPVNNDWQIEFDLEENEVEQG